MGDSDFLKTLGGPTVDRETHRVSPARLGSKPSPEPVAWQRLKPDRTEWQMIDADEVEWCKEVGYAVRPLYAGEPI